MLCDSAVPDTERQNVLACKDAVLVGASIPLMGLARISLLLRQGLMWQTNERILLNPIRIVQIAWGLLL